MHIKDTIDYQLIFSFKSILLKVVGVIMATIAFEGFMIPNHFLDGGINGLSILIYETLHIPISIPLILLNIPFIAIGYYKIGKTFAVNSMLSILMLAIALFLFDVPTVTSDKFLIAIFGGAFMGVAIGAIIRSGGVIDGLEVIADYTNKKVFLTSGEIILTINVIIFFIAGYKYGLETAMYSIITFYTALKISTYVVEGVEAYTEVTIVSTKPELIKKIIVEDFKKAISVYKGERGYIPNKITVTQPSDIIVTVLTRLEVFQIRNAIQFADPVAFIYTQNISEVSGGVIKQLRTH